MIKKHTLSVGIPAYNEERNIKKLIKSILSQAESTYKINELIIVSDGSYDKTDEIIKELHARDRRIKYIIDGMRRGKTARLNQILRKFNSDIVFLIDADVEIDDINLFENIISNTDFTEVFTCAVNSQPTTGSNWFQRSLNYSVRIQEIIRSRWNGGRNYLCFRGSFIGISKEMAKKIDMPENLINNDAFVYFSAVAMGGKIKYFSNLSVYYVSPRNMDDHLKQVARFKISREEIGKYFKNLDLDKEYSIPKFLYYSTLLKTFVNTPFYFTSFLLIFIWSRLIHFEAPNVKWDIVGSTKQ